MKTAKVSKVHNKPSRGPAALSPRIVEEAGRLFLSRGFVGVTSDEIASRLGISKATLYKAFPGKEAILRAVVRGHMADIQAGVERLIADRSLDFIEKMVGLLSFLSARLSRFGPVLVRDLRRLAPGLWREIEDFRRDKILKNFKVILEDGRREGCFRADLDLGLLLAMFLDLIQRFVTPDEILRTGRSPAETFRTVAQVFFQGILTDRGRKSFGASLPALFESGKESLS